MIREVYRAASTRSVALSPTGRAGLGDRARRHEARPPRRSEELVHEAALPQLREEAAR